MNLNQNYFYPVSSQPENPVSGPLKQPERPHRLGANLKGRSHGIRPIQSEQFDTTKFKWTEPKWAEPKQPQMPDMSFMKLPGMESSDHFLTFSQAIVQS